MPSLLQNTDRAKKRTRWLSMPGWPKCWRSNTLSAVMKFRRSVAEHYAVQKEEMTKTFGNISWRSPIVALLVACQLCTACTTTRQVPLLPKPALADSSLETGRKVVIELRGGERIVGTLAGLDDNGLTVRAASGAVRSVAYEDMASVQTTSISWGRTAAAVGGAVLAVGAVFLAMLRSDSLRSD